jgi:hypothetical protein
MLRLPNPSDSRPRPVWSELSYVQKAALALKMQTAYKRMAADTTTRGLRYQMWLHAWFCGALVNSNIDVHSDWTFLLWHRGFLYAHELLLQHFLGGDKTFRLPVWDWENSPEVPWMYNPVPSDTGLSCACPRNDGILPVTDACLQGWLQAGSFQAFAGNEKCPGNVVNYVHSDVHGQLSGYMGDPSTAAFDPVFYGHHANVDRYWVYWKNQTGFADGWDDAAFKDPLYFYYDENGNAAGIQKKSLLDPKLLGYSYGMPTRPKINNKIEIVPATAKDNTVTFSNPDWQHLLDRVSALLRVGTLETNVAGQLLQWAAKAPQLNLVCQVDAKNTNLTNGRYYSVEIRVPGETAGVPVGGFAMFMGKRKTIMANDPLETVKPVVSLNLEAIAMLARSTLRGELPSIELVYGPALIDGVARRTGRAVIDGPALPLPLSRFVVQFVEA